MDSAPRELNNESETPHRVSRSMVSAGGTRNTALFRQRRGGRQPSCPQRAPFPHCEDKRRTRDALSDPGVALVVSLWKAEDLSWLDGGCNQWTAQGRGMCNLVSTSFSISNLRVSEIPKPPPSLAALVAASDANTSATPICAAGRHDGGAR